MPCFYWSSSSSINMTHFLINMLWPKDLNDISQIKSLFQVDKNPDFLHKHFASGLPPPKQTLTKLDQPKSQTPLSSVMWSALHQKTIWMKIQFPDFFCIITNFGSKNVDGKIFFGKTFGSKTILDQTKLAQHNFLPWPVLTWPILTWPFLNQPILTRPVLTCSDLTCLDLSCPDCICPDLTWPDLTCPDLVCPVTELLEETFQTPSRHPPKTFQTPFWHVPDSFQTHFKCSRNIRHVGPFLQVEVRWGLLLLFLLWWGKTKSTQTSTN